MTLLLVLVLLIISNFIVIWLVLRSMFKIAYYEKKLDNLGVDITSVSCMPLYKLWIN